MRAQSSTLIPDPCDTMEAATRYQHRDLPDLHRPDAWAELTVIEAELARRLWRDRGRDRPRDPHAIAWLRERARRLRRRLREVRR